VSGKLVKPGSLIVVTTRSDNNNGPVTSVTTIPAGSQPCALARRHQSVTGFWLDVWFCPNAVGGLTNVTVKLSGPSDQMRIALAEYSGIAASNPVDNVASGTGTSATANAGSITTLGANRLIHVAVGSDGNDDADRFTPGSGYTIHNLGPDPDGSDKTMTEHRSAATAGSYGATMGNVNDSWAAVAVAFKASGSGTTNPPPAAPTQVRIIR
jgi:hypothetical protein